MCAFLLFPLCTHSHCSFLVGPGQSVPFGCWRCWIDERLHLWLPTAEQTTTHTHSHRLLISVRNGICILYGLLVTHRTGHSIRRTCVATQNLFFLFAVNKKHLSHLKTASTTLKPFCLNRKRNYFCFHSTENVNRFIQIVVNKKTWIELLQIAQTVPSPRCIAKYVLSHAVNQFNSIVHCFQSAAGNEQSNKSRL